MFIVCEYSDEGKSGKSVEGRPQFKQMLADIESGKDNVDYVLVFKLPGILGAVNSILYTDKINPIILHFLQ